MKYKHKKREVKNQTIQNKREIEIKKKTRYLEGSDIDESTTKRKTVVR